MTTSVATEAPIDVNGVTVPNRPGGRVLAVLRHAGANVPTLCYDDRLEPQGACRMCLVEVEIDGPTRVVYRPDRPLSCGAVLWVETNAPVRVDGVLVNVSLRRQKLAESADRATR